MKRAVQEKLNASVFQKAVTCCIHKWAERFRSKVLHLGKGYACGKLTALLPSFYPASN